MKERKIFPCFSGAALRGEGVREFLDGMELLTQTDWESRKSEPFAALAYQVRRGQSRIVWLKVTAGRLRCRDEVSCRAADGSLVKEKVTELFRCRGGRLFPIPGGEGGRAVLRSGADRCARRGRRGRAGACASRGS